MEVRQLAFAISSLLREHVQQQQQQQWRQRQQQQQLGLSAAQQAQDAKAGSGHRGWGHTVKEAPGWSGSHNIQTPTMLV